VALWSLNWLFQIGVAVICSSCSALLCELKTNAKIQKKARYLGIGLLFLPAKLLIF
jgi:hypothetical protein